MKAKHTPKPWTTSKSAYGPNGDIFGADGSMVIVDTNGYPSPEDAADIVLCGNAHEKLVEAARYFRNLSRRSDAELVWAANGIEFQTHSATLADAEPKGD